MSFTNEVKKGLIEGVKGIPAALRAKKVEFGSPVGKYAMGSFSPNNSARKVLNNVNKRFRREAAGEAKEFIGNVKRKLFNNTPSPPQPRVPLATPAPRLRTPFIPKPSPYLLPTPMNYRRILSPSNTTPREPELRGGACRKTRKNKQSKRLTRRFVKPKILRY